MASSQPSIAETIQVWFTFGTTDKPTLQGGGLDDAGEPSLQGPYVVPLSATVQTVAEAAKTLVAAVDSDADWTTETKYYLTSVPLTKTVPGARSTKPSILIHPLKPQWAHVPVTLLADPDGQPVGPNSAIELHIWKSIQTSHSEAAPSPSPPLANEAPRKGHKKKAATAPGDQPAARRSRSVESSPANP